MFAGCPRAPWISTFLGAIAEDLAGWLKVSQDWSLYIVAKTWEVVRCKSCKADKKEAKAKETKEVEQEEAGIGLDSAVSAMWLGRRRFVVDQFSMLIDLVRLSAQ